MTVPVWSAVPDSTLTPAQVAQKFAPRTMAGLRGLGDCVDGYDEWGEYCGTGGIDFGSTATQPDGTPWPFDPLLTAGGTSSAPISITGLYTDAGGDLVANLSNGQSVSVQQNGHVVHGAAGTPATGTISQAQASAWPAVIAALANAGVRIATVSQLPAGATLLPNGTVVGSGQSLLHGAVNPNPFATILSNPVLLIGGLAVVLLLAESR